MIILDSGEFSAVPSLLGYYYQGMYALIVLLNATDNATVSIETADDVYLDGEVKSLHQLKHSENPGQTLTIKNDGFWKTIRIWSVAIKERLTDNSQFAFVTTHSIKQNDVLCDLCNPDIERTRICEAMLKEAKRVVQERQKARVLSRWDRAAWVNSSSNP